MLKELFEFRETNRKWHLAVLAGICVGVPLLTGFFSHSLADAKLASLAGLVILYVHEERTRDQMITLMICSFGIMLSFTVGVIFSFHPYWSALFLGLYAFGVHRALYLLGLHKPPGNFFFIMIASVAVCLPFEIDSIPHKIGLVGLGTMSSCILGFVYSLMTAKDHIIESASAKTVKSRQSNVVESVTFGFFIGLGLLIGRLLELDNPYWIPSSSAAVMQGISSKHIWQRSIQRVVGTFIGLIVTWLILRLHPTPLVICVSIVLFRSLLKCWLEGIMA